ncbi:levanase [Halanaerobium saccharolyticum]|jgi:fructan beta-fructosidase|uniref:Levanase n=1 Tax=Halanaerobium saccharolyticum TaxID=43595 RepID=A0A2T5RG73_9FIRM|nr:glycoside hydrolase family 32 protein [Halanaerobium saccharolyticum]PTV93481.1 levanase [Halanaerobium saccharolyticum]
MKEIINKNANYYKEKYRPQIHFTPQKNWMNDPNGLVYYKGKYHLFYQHHPYSNVWGPMHWGHAVSEDLLHWEHLPIALAPDEETGMAFSGSAVVDYNDSSGFFEGKSGLVLIYTSTLPESEGGHQQQCIAYSEDDGLSWHKYSANPVIKNKVKTDFRDPKVFWHQKTKKWVMVLVAGDRVEFYNSSNLKDWKYLSEFGSKRGSHGGVWECPDLFPIEEEDKEYWVLKVDVQKGAIAGGSGGQYFVGHFDGKIYSEIDNFNDVNWLDYGQDFYAAQSWNNLPGDNKRNIWLGWMSNWDYANEVPTEVWKSAMSIPRELKLIKEKEEFNLLQQPINELKELRNEKYIFKNLRIGKNNNKDFKGIKNPLEIVADFYLENKVEFEIQFKFNEDNLTLSYNDRNSKVIINRENSASSFHPDFKSEQIADLGELEKMKLQIFIDWSSIEIFINDGRWVITDLIFPEEVEMDIILNNFAEELIIDKLEIFELDSIW